MLCLTDSDHLLQEHAAITTARHKWPVPGDFGANKVVWPSLASVSEYVYIYVALPTVNLYRRLNRSVSVEECFACSSDRRHAVSTGGHHRDP